MEARTNILLIEDNGYDRDLIERELKKQRISNEFLHFTDGQSAIDYLHSKGEYAGFPVPISPALILLDLNLPRLTGIEVLQKIKTHPRTRKIPVVVLTGSNSERDISLAYLNGANSFVEKPLNFSQFAAAIREIGLYWLILNQQPER